MESQGFQDLVRLAQAGDRHATSRVLQLLRPHLERLAQRYVDRTRPGESVCDLAQEVEVRVWQKLAQFRGGDGDEQTLALFRGWLGQIVQRLGLNTQRKNKAQRRQPAQPVRALAAVGTSDTIADYDPAADEPTPSMNVRQDEQTQLVRQALDRIADAADRALLRLHFFEGLSLRQAAQQLQLSYDSARTRYQRSLAQLESQLARLL
jgi:RNA polymerase sigma factor (sigma-70 family)